MTDSPSDEEVEQEASAAPHATEEASDDAGLAEHGDLVSRLRKVQADEGHSAATLASLLDLPEDTVQQMLDGEHVPEDAADRVVRWLGPTRP